MVNAIQNTDTAAALYASLNASSSSLSKTATSANSSAATQDRFLTLLVTQMKNQDPLNPMDNAQVTSQMAQLSTVSGIDKLNATLQALSDSMTPNQALQAATMIGHGVLVTGGGIDLSGGKGYGGVDLAQKADNVTITINDSAGALVRKISLGSQAAGTVNWQWDGLNQAGTAAPDGAYKFTVSAVQGGNPVDATALQFGVVNSVTQNQQGVALSVGGMEGVALSQVRQIV